MNTVFFGQPSEAFIRECKKRYPVGHNQIFVDLVGGGRKEIVMDELSGQCVYNGAAWIQYGTQRCQDGSTIDNTEISCISSDFGCECLSVGNSAMKSCHDLRLVYMPTVVTVGEQAFSRCAKLSYASFDKCQDVRTGAFSRCGWLIGLNLPSASEEYVRQNLPNWGMFSGCPISCRSETGEIVVITS